MPEQPAVLLADCSAGLREAFRGKDTKNTVRDCKTKNISERYITPHTFKTHESFTASRTFT